VYCVTMFKNQFLKKPHNEIEPQEILLDLYASQEKKIEIPLSVWSTRALYALFLLGIALFGFKTFELQVLASHDMRQLAHDNTLRSIPLVAERGVLYDQSGTQLVFNRSSFDIVCDKRELPPRLLDDLSVLFDVSQAELHKEFNRVYSPTMLISQNISHDHLVRAEARLKEFPGCRIQENSVREYGRDMNLSHVFGYTAKISPEELSRHPDYTISSSIGKTGIERTYEEKLRGVPGQILTEKDAFGNIVKDQGQIDSVPGQSISLWLDGALQQKIAQALQKGLDRLGTRKGAAVAIDPRNGGVLALVSFPDFDNNLFSQGISTQQYQEIISDKSNPLFNRAIAGTYPTGSTIKPFIAAAALQENIIDPDTPMFTEGYIEIPNRYDPDVVYTFPDWKNHGWVDMRDAIAVSSNVYFYTIGGGFEDQKGLGPSRIKHYLSLFGWGSGTGIDIPGEAVGLLPDPDWKKLAKEEGWWDGDTYLMSIGQGDVLATPLQVAAGYAAIANGGTLYEPHILQSDPVVIRSNFIDPEHIQVVKEGMRRAVTWGSSVSLNQLPIDVAVKTGTAQTGKKDSDNKDFLYTWTSAFAPYDDPEIVLTVVIEDVKEGSLAVLPIMQEIFQWYAAR
jgi:penicillin-binding protein 2